MASGDGLLVRITPPPGGITAAQAQGLSDAAARFGNGRIGLTGRARLQIRGLTPEAVAPFAAAMGDLGLAAPDPSMERRRAMLTLAPLLDRDPGAAAIRPHLLSLAADLLAQPALDLLPDKFGLVLDGGSLVPLDGLAADIRIRLAPGRAWIGLADRAWAECAPAEVAEAVRSLLAFCAAPPRRMRDAVSELGVARLFAAAGLEESAGDPPLRFPPQAVGFLPDAGGGRGAFGLGAPFGLMDTAQLSALADLAQLYGDGRLRPLPWRAVVIAGVGAAEAAALTEAAMEAGWIADPADPRRRIAACVGRPACASAAVNTLAMAERIARALGPDDTGGPVDIHIAGCAKGCAHAGPAAVTLIGEAGGPEERFALVRHGRAGDPSVLSGLSGEDAIAAALGVLEKQR
jgi:precorrin-3B synthase